MRVCQQSLFEGTHFLASLAALIAAFSSSVFSADKSVDMKREELSGRRQQLFVSAAAAADGGVRGAFVKKALEKSGPELKTARRIPADDMNRSI